MRQTNLSEPCSPRLSTAGGRTRTCKSRCEFYKEALVEGDFEAGIESGAQFDTGESAILVSYRTRSSKCTPHTAYRIEIVDVGIATFILSLEQHSG